MLLFVVAENSGVISTTPVLVVVHVFIYYGSGFVRRIPLYFSPLPGSAVHLSCQASNFLHFRVRSYVIFSDPVHTNGNKIYDGFPEAYYWCATTIVFRHKNSRDRKPRKILNDLSDELRTVF